VEIRKEGKSIPVHFGTYNLMGNRTVTELKTNSNGLNPELLNEIVYDVISRHLEGESVTDLSELKGESPPWFLLPRLVAQGGATHLIAAGGMFKSYIALAAAFTIATGDGRYIGSEPKKVGPVLYLDWEASRDTFMARSRALTGGQPPKGVHYQPQKQPLRRSADAIAKRCDELGIILLVVDSLMLARGGDAFGPEETIALFASLREIGRPSVVIDHKSQEAIRKGRRGAYGSVVGANSIRLTWEVVGRSETKTGDILLRLEQGKSNDIPKGEDLGYRITPVNEAERIKTMSIVPVDPNEALADLVEGDDLADQLHRAMISGEPFTVKELEQATEIKGSTLRTVLARHENRRFKKQKVGRSTKWRLINPHTPEQRHLQAVPELNEDGEPFQEPEEDPW
jgi:hypothetical protein